MVEFLFWVFVARVLLLVFVAQLLLLVFVVWLLLLAFVAEHLCSIQMGSAECLLFENGFNALGTWICIKGSSCVLGAGTGLGG